MNNLQVISGTKVNVLPLDTACSVGDVLCGLEVDGLAT